MPTCWYSELVLRISFARQQLYFLGLDPAVRTAQSIQLDHYRRAVFEARQIPYLPLVNLGNFLDPSTTAGTLQFAVPALPPHPQLQDLVLLVDLVPVHAVTGPLQDSCEFVIGRQSLNLAQNRILGMSVNSAALRILAQSHNTLHATW